MGLVRGIAVAALSLAVAGCGGPFGPCVEERIEVRVEGTVASGAGASPVASVDLVAPTNFEDFDLVRRIVIEGEPLPRILIWTAVLSGQPSGSISAFVPGPLRVGQVLPLRAVRGGGWGAPPAAGETDALVDFRYDGVSGATVQGTLTVVALQPMRLRLQFTATDPSGASRTADLTATFAYTRTRGPCT